MPIHASAKDLQTTLDILVPWLAFAYGIVMVFVFQSPRLMELARTRIPEPFRSRFLAHGALGWVCLVVGGLWILQSLWLA